MSRDSERQTLVDLVREYRWLDELRIKSDLSDEQYQRYSELKANVERRILRQSTEAANRRTSSRVEVTEPLNVSFPDSPAFRKSYIRNISGGGVFIETDAAIPMGTKLRLNMAFKARRLECEVQCVWVNKQPTDQFGRGVGLKFLDLTPDQAQFIHEMVFREIERQAQKHQD